MNVTIIGTGSMANAIAARLVAGGHNANLHTREEVVAHAQQLQAQDIQNTAAPIEEIVIFAVPYQEALSIANGYSAWLAGKIVIDITNPVNLESMELETAPGSSAAQEIAKLLPTTCKLVKAFNTNFAESLVEGEVDGRPLDVFVAGDDDEAKKIVAKLVQDGGLRSIDVGPLPMARHLESMQLIHMAVQEKMGFGGTSTIKILS